MSNWIEEHSRNLWIGLFGLVFASFAWFVRTFLTNQTQIALLTQDLSSIKTDLCKIEAKYETSVENQKEILGLLKTILKEERENRE